MRRPLRSVLLAAALALAVVACHRGEEPAAPAGESAEAPAPQPTERAPAPPPIVAGPEAPGAQAAPETGAEKAASKEGASQEGASGEAAPAQAAAPAAEQPEQPAKPKPPSEVVVYNARDIITMDPARPRAAAVAVADGRILAVGGFEAVTEAAGKRPVRVDRRFEDMVLMPGFIDDHLHPALAAALLPGEFDTPYPWRLPGRGGVGVREVPGMRGRTNWFRRLHRLESAMPPGHDWLVVWGYHPLFHGAVNRANLDDVSKTRPILVWHRSFHEIIVNSAALRAWKIREADLAGVPDTDWKEGRFWEKGLLEIRDKLAQVVLRPGRYEEGLREARELFHRGGLTTICDQGFPTFDPDFELKMLHRVYDEKDTPFRTLLVPNGMTLAADGSPEKALAIMEKLPETDTSHVRFLHQVELFADGAFYSQLMQLRKPYTDGHKGVWLMDPDDLESAALFWWRHGWPIHVQVNGDRGVDVVLDILENLLGHKRWPDHRFTLEHYGVSTKGQAERVERLGALVSANPWYLWAMGDVYADKGLGPERAHAISRLGSLVAEGVRVSLHSDLPMAPAEPLALAWVAANRITAQGQVFAPEERLTVEQALRAITIDAAYAIHMDDQIGSITPGKRADFTVLEQDPLAVPREKLKDVPIWGTVFEGRPYPIQPIQRGEGEPEGAGLP